MPVDFSLLQAIQPGQVIGKLAPAPADDGMGDLFKGLAGLGAGVKSAMNPQAASGTWGKEINNTQYSGTAQNNLNQQMDVPGTAGLQGALQRNTTLRSNNDEYAHGGTTTPQSIIFHDTAGPSFQSASDTLKQRGLSYNYIIDKDGTVHELVPAGVKAFHAKGYNDNTVGVSFVGGGGFGDVNPAQQQSAVVLAQQLHQKFPSITSFAGHRDRTNAGKPDPEGFDYTGFEKVSGLKFSAGPGSERYKYDTSPGKQTEVVPPSNGLLTPGNINLNNRPRVNNPDGSYSTVRTITADIDGKTVLLPTVINGKIVSNQEAIQHYKQTGEHMGIFNSQQAADQYDQNMHKQQGWTGPNNKWNQSSLAIPNVVQASNQTYGPGSVMAGVAAAQAILESGLTGKPSKLATQGNNLFGIKGSGTAGTVNLGTQEYGKNGYEHTRSGFAKNASVNDSFSQHQRLMQNPRYQGVLNAKSVPEALIELQKAGYATDPKYAKKLLEIYNKYVAPAQGQLSLGGHDPVRPGFVPQTPRQDPGRPPFQAGSIVGGPKLAEIINSQTAQPYEGGMQYAPTPAGGSQMPQPDNIPAETARGDAQSQLASNGINWGLLNAFLSKNRRG